MATAAADAKKLPEVMGEVGEHIDYIGDYLAAAYALAEFIKREECAEMFDSARGLIRVLDDAEKRLQSLEDYLRRAKAGGADIN